MATALKLRRGTTTQHATFTGAEGEITVDTTKDTAVVHDGTTAGGFPLVTETGTQTLTNKTLASPVITGASILPAGSASAPAITTTGDTNTGIFFPAADTIAFSEGGTEAMRIDASGNLGVGVTPSAWGSGVKALQVNAGAGIMGDANNYYVLANSYYDGTNFKYINSSFALNHRMAGGVYSWYTAPSGTAGATVPFTERMTLNASGNLGLGCTPSPVTLGKVIEVGSTANGLWNASTADTRLMTNVYYDSGTLRYGSTNVASMMETGSGFVWRIAPSGTAGNPITFTEAMSVDTSSNLKFNSGYGSAATAYGCRAWVNFNGTGTVAIRASGNVSSITDLGVGSYTVNFTNAMPDVNYCVSGSASAAIANLIMSPFSAATMLTTSVRVYISNTSAGGDNAVVSVAIHR